jgi:hypothetical protein
LSAARRLLLMPPMLRRDVRLFIAAHLMLVIVAIAGSL